MGGNEGWEEGAAPGKSWPVEWEALVWIVHGEVLCRGRTGQALGPLQAHSLTGDSLERPWPWPNIVAGSCHPTALLIEE